MIAIGDSAASCLTLANLRTKVLETTNSILSNVFDAYDILGGMLIWA